MMNDMSIGDRVSTYEEVVRRLICDLGMRGKMSIDLFMGREDWHFISTGHKKDYKKKFRMYDIPFVIYEVRYRKQVLLLGTDRLQMCMGLDLYEQAGKFNAQVRNDYIERLSIGKFPNPENQDEVALEMDLLLNPPSDIMDVL